MTRLKSVMLSLTLLASAVGAVEPEPLSYYTVAPCRWVDTRENECEAGSLIDPRDDVDCPTGALQDGETRYYNAQEAPVCPDGGRPIPLGAQVLAVNVTVVDATARGHLVLYDATKPRPGISSINFDVRTARSNLVFIPLGQEQGQDPSTPFWPDTAVYAHVVGDGAVHLILDVVGYFK